MDGTVKYFNSNRGFGFIHVPGEPDRFFHISELKGPESPTTGDYVTFDVAAGMDGRPIAVQVQIWHCCAANRNPDRARLAWDGEVPCIR
jgi:CspA family cold shock protein